MAAAHLVSSSPGGRVGVRWWVGDIPRLLVTFSRACSIGLATVGVAGRPGGGAGGDSFGVNLVDANGDASWRRCSMGVESLLNIAGVRVSSPAKNCLMSMVGVSSSLNSITSLLAVDFIVGPCRILASSSRLVTPPDTSAIRTGWHRIPVDESIRPNPLPPDCLRRRAHHHGNLAPDRVCRSMGCGCRTQQACAGPGWQGVLRLPPVPSSRVPAPVATVPARILFEQSPPAVFQFRAGAQVRASGLQSTLCRHCSSFNRRSDS